MRARWQRHRSILSCITKRLKYFVYLPLPKTLALFAFLDFGEISEVFSQLRQL